MKNATKVLIVIVILLTAGIAGFLYLSHPKAVTANADDLGEISGSIEAKETNVNIKIPGRVQEVSFEEGDTVTQGQTIATIEADNLLAKAQLAQAALDAATAQYNKAKNGARPQQLEQARNMVIQAESGYKLAKSTYQRLELLYNEGVLAQQKLDMARTDMEVAEMRYNAAKEQLNLVQEGAQKEDVEAAAALVRQARAAYNEVMSYIRDASVRAPISGIITMKAIEPGEMVSSGMALATISDLKNIWVEVKVRETALDHFQIGQTVNVRVLGVPGQTYKGKVVLIGAKPSFATERATQEKGEKDVVSFGVKIKLPNDELKLRPGMTAVVTLN